mmetsp:Transcript_4122/g.6752  ORF Transcript_4122/g.6752 Transcript_4122/m.6752 type:complete len:424 (+) Transcript_4122:70-1341(+)
MHSIAAVLLSQQAGNEAALQAFIEEQSQIPASLLVGLSEAVSSDDSYGRDTEQVNLRHIEMARWLIDDLQPGLKHHSIHCVSFTSSTKSLIGMSIEEFGRLFASVRADLAEAYPRCPELLKPGEVSSFASRRLKLFLCLFRLKLGTSFREMEAMFGWSNSVIQDWFDVVLKILHRRLRPFHVDFLAARGNNWQAQQIIRWAQRHIDEDTYDSFKQRLSVQNTYQQAHNESPIIDGNNFVGSIGAVDGTYSICPRRSNDIDTHTGHNRMFSDYKKVHAYKVVAIMSHGQDGEGKFILGMANGPGSASDKSIYLKMLDELVAKLVRGAALLGDHAFHSCKLVIVPYTTSQLLAGDQLVLGGFNHVHSSDRMTSEHCMRYLKSWGMARGRDDEFLFIDREGDEVADRVFETVWGLHNYITSNCPVF